MQKESCIRKLIDHIDFKDDVVIKIDDKSNEALIQYGRTFPKIIKIVNKFSVISKTSSEVRIGNVKKLYGNHYYEILYRSNKIISNYEDEDYASAADKLSNRIKSYIK